MTTWADLKKNSEKKWMALSRPTSKSDENYRSISLKDVDFEVEPRLVEKQSFPKELQELACNEVAICLVSSASSQPLLLSGTAKAQDVFVSIADNEETSWALTDDLEKDYFAQWAASRAALGLRVKKDAKTYFKSEDSTRTSYFFDAESECFFYRTKIEVDALQNLRHVDEFVGGPGEGRNGTAVGLIQIHVRSGATLDYSLVQNWDESVTHFTRIEIVAEKDAQVRMVPFQVGGKKGQIRIEKQCTGSGAQIEIEGAAQGKNTQQFDFWIRATHKVPDTQSHMTYHTVMNDQSKAVFNGNIVITHDALRTKATQKNKNILLSSQASIDTFPKLEIATDEVECSHGASSSPISPEQKYYLESRGISSEEAEVMIIRGFIGPIVKKIVSEGVKARIYTKLGTKDEEAVL